MKKIGVVIGSIGILLIIILPTYIYNKQFGTLPLSNERDDWGTFGDYVGGLLNPFISILTLAITAYIAYTFNQYEKRRDGQSKREEDLNSFLEIYKYFTSMEFREKRHIAWNVVRRAMEIPEYKTFLIQETFCSRYKNRMDREDVYMKFKDKLYPNQYMEKRPFLHKESEDRHKLDSVIDFFQLLAIKEIPSNYFKTCDFYYDSWRPVLYWYARELEKGYNANELNKKFNNPPAFKEALMELDKKFYNPVDKDALTFENIDQHPMIEWYLNSKDTEEPQERN